MIRRACRESYRLTRNEPAASEEPNQRWFPREPLGRRVQFPVFVDNGDTFLRDSVADFGIDIRSRVGKEAITGTGLGVDSDERENRVKDVLGFLRAVDDSSLREPWYANDQRYS